MLKDSHEHRKIVIHTLLVFIGVPAALVLLAVGNDVKGRWNRHVLTNQRIRPTSKYLLLGSLGIDTHWLNRLATAAAHADHCRFYW